MTKEFDAPSFTRFADSAGHVEYPTSTNVQLNFTKRTPLQAGQTVRFEVEVDAHFSPDDYRVKWQVANIPGAETGEGTAFPLTLTPKHVSTDFVIFVSVSANRDWHRHGDCDARLVLVYRVLPPV
jgi:hypothetical protein